MAAPLRQPYYTVAEYLEYDNNSPIKNEYVDGQIIAMLGGSSNHSLISMAIGRILDTQLLDRPCKVYNSDMGVEVDADTMYAYPDVTVVCGDSQYKNDRGAWLLNPTVIIEVLSPSTENYDRGEFLAYYREMTSLREYLIVAQDRMQVEHYVRQENGWLLTVIRGSAGIVHIPSIDCELALADVYRKAEFGESSR